MLGVSLYIPCYNAAGYLDRVLAAVMAQTHPIEEVLVIDDGSTDATASVAEAWRSKARYPLRVVRHPGNLGLACARNTGVREARTDLIACVDSDVAPEPRWLATLMEEMSPEVSGVGGELLECYQETLPDRWRARHMLQRRGSQRIYRPPFIWGSNALFRREAIYAAGLYNVRCRTNAEDVKLCELIRDSHVLVYTPKAKCMHLRRDTVRSVMRNYWKWYYYGCFKTPRFGETLASNRRHVARTCEGFWQDIAEGDLPLAALSLAMVPYTCLRDWMDLWKRRGETC
jgi:glycosyltransferase involved in cell wall biosynthesis